MRIKLILIFCFLAAYNTATQSQINKQDKSNSDWKKYALIIGNSNYKKCPIHAAEKEANMMSDSLKKIDFEVTKVINADQVTMKKSIAQFYDKVSVDKEAIIIFYYSGHAAYSKGINYLIPINTVIEQEDDLEYDCVCLDYLFFKMDYSNQKNLRLNIIILDACRENCFTPYLQSIPNRGLASVYPPVPAYIAFSSAPGTVINSELEDTSLYPSELAAALQIPNLQLYEVFKMVREEVCKKSGEKQIPWENSNIDGDFYLNLK